MLLGKLEGWEDVVESALEYCEEKLSDDFNWSSADLADIKAHSNKDVRAINAYLNSLKVLGEAK